MTDYQIKPEKSAPKIDTSSWPLLLKVRTVLTHQLFAFDPRAARNGSYLYGQGVSWGLGAH